eukprot:g13428.t1
MHKFAMEPLREHQTGVLNLEASKRFFKKYLSRFYRPINIETVTTTKTTSGTPAPRLTTRWAVAAPPARPARRSSMSMWGELGVL